jgi:hypothetical protein
MLVLPIFVATLVTACILWLYEIRRPQAQQREHREIVQQEVQRQPQQAYEQSTSRILFIAQAALLLVVLATLFMQGWSYGQADAAYTFQSPSCMIAPANNDPILAYLQQEHIRYAWAISWIGYPLDFKANGSIIIADPRPAITRPPTAGRLPATTVIVEAADRPSMLVFVRHGDPHPLVLRILNSEGITYRTALFPAEPGFDVLVVTPLNRTASPFDAGGYHEVFAPC